VCVRGAGIENDRNDLCLFSLVLYVQVLKSIYTYRFEIISEIEIVGGAASESAADKNVAERPDAQGVATTEVATTIRAESKGKGPADGEFELTERRKGMGDYVCEGGSDRPKRVLEDKAAPNDQQSKKHKQPRKEVSSPGDAEGQSEAASSMNLETPGKALDPKLLQLYQDFGLEDDAEDLARHGIKRESDLKYFHKNAPTDLISKMKLPLLTEQKLRNLVASCGQHEQAAASGLEMESEAGAQVSNRARSFREAKGKARMGEHKRQGEKSPRSAKRELVLPELVLPSTLDQVVDSATLGGADSSGDGGSGGGGKRDRDEKGKAADDMQRRKKKKEVERQERADASEKLASMGFELTAHTKELLRKHDNNLDTVIEALLSMQERREGQDEELSSDGMQASGDEDEDLRRALALSAAQVECDVQVYIRACVHTVCVFV
jgi:hypothetical protein